MGTADNATPATGEVLDNLGRTPEEAAADKKAEKAEKAAEAKAKSKARKRKPAKKKAVAAHKTQVARDKAAVAAEAKVDEKLGAEKLTADATAAIAEEKRLAREYGAGTPSINAIPKPAAVKDCRLKVAGTFLQDVIKCGIDTSKVFTVYYDMGTEEFVFNQPAGAAKATVSAPPARAYRTVNGVQIPL